MPMTFDIAEAAEIKLNIMMNVSLIGVVLQGPSVKTLKSFSSILLSVKDRLAKWEVP